MTPDKKELLEILDFWKHLLGGRHPYNNNRFGSRADRITDTEAEMIWTKIANSPSLRRYLPSQDIRAPIYDTTGELCEPVYEG